MYSLLKRSLLIAVVLMASMTWAYTADQIRLVNKLELAEKKYGLPSGYLVAVATIETLINNYAFNVDGVGFHMSSEKEVISALYNITKNPYLIRAKTPEGKELKYFTSTEISAKTRVDQLKAEGFSIRTQKGQEYRRLTTITTDVCVLQINNKYHVRDQFRSINEVLNEDACIDYGARFLSTLIEKHGLKNGVGCYNTCRIGSEAHQIYVQRFEEAYKRLFNKSAYDI